MALQTQQLAVEDFSGGITDYVLNAQPNQSATIENLVINNNQRLEAVAGSAAYYPTDAAAQIPAGNVRVCGLFKSLDPVLYVNSARNIWYADTSSWTVLNGPTGNPAISTGTTASFISTSEWNEHTYVTNSDYAVPVKIYKDGSGVPVVRTAGLPDLSATPTVGGTAGLNNYIYAFHYYYQYQIGTTTFEDYGPTTLVPKTSIAQPSVSSVSITGLPVLSNGATLNYDTATIKIYIYRTANNGLTLYKIGEVTNGTTTFTDNFADNAITSNLLLYTNGGVLDYDPPPLCKYVHVVNSVAYYCNIKDGANIYRNQIRQSIPGDPDSAPAVLTIDLLEEIVGISSYNDNPIVFTKKRVYRLNGLYDELGQGQVTYEDITKTVGCVSNNSIVQTRYGVFWAGDDGFYWTDGFQFKKVSDSINERYKDLVSSATRAARIYGTYDTVKNDVIWACTSQDNSTDNDCFFALDLRWGITEASCFTTRVGGDSFSPTAVVYYGNDLVRGDRRGYVFRHNSSYTTDPKINTLANYSTWTTQTIIPNYVSTVFNFGLPMVRKWVAKMLISMQNETDVSVQINSINDQSTTTDPLLPIRVRENVLWGTTTTIWGGATPSWSSSQLIEQMRRFPATGLRCSFKQIQITQAYTAVYNSDTFGVANVNSTTKVASLTGGLAWPTDSVDYYITFNSDNYVKQYLITAISPAVAVFTVSSANATAGAVYQASNGNTYTVTTTISGGLTLTTTANGLPPVSGNLTKLSGTGDTTIVFSSYTYTQGQLTYQDPTTTQPTASNAEWVINGYPKGEIFNILSYVIYYAPLTSQSYRTYRTEQDSTGGNT